MKGNGITEKGKLTIALVITLIIAVVCFFTLNTWSYAESSTKSSKSNKSKNSESSTKDTSNGNKGKETVYVMQKANGKEYKRVVSDEGNLKYKGYDNATLPITMKVSYTLDGKSIKAKDLAGESGHVKIHITYTNNEKRNNVYVPFTAMSVFVFDADDFSNVKVDNGKVVDDGTRNTVVGYAMPGLKESLNVELSDSDLEIPESVTIECDTTKYSCENAYTMVTDELLEDLDLNDVNSLDDVSGKLDDVKSAAKQLASGTDELVSGANQVASGASTLADKSKDLKDGAKAVSDGSAALKNSTPTLTGGVSKLATGSKSLAEGNEQLLSALKQLYGSAPTEDSEGSGTLALAAGAKQLNDSVKDFELSEIKLTEEQKSGIKQQAAGSTSVTDAANKLSSGIGSAVASQVGSVNSDENKAAAAKKVLADENVQNAVKALVAAGYTQDQAEALFTGVSSSTLDSVATQVSEDGITQSISGSVTSTMQQVAGAAAVGGAEATVSTVNSKLSDYQPMIKQLKSGASALADGTAKVNVALAGTDGKGEETEDKDTNLIKAASQLSSGSSELYSGITSLQGGSKKLVSGVNQLNNGSLQLYNGTVAFSQGQNKLATGAKALASGTKTLDKSIDEAISEAKGELNKLEESNVLNAVDNAKAVQKAAEDYTSFGNTTKTYKSVTFIYKMDEVSPK